MNFFRLTPFAHDNINLLANKSSTSIEKYEILLYIDAILKFFKMSTRELNKKSVTIGVYPMTIVNKILDDYTVVSENNRSVFNTINERNYFHLYCRSRPLSMRDKAASFILVLSLIAMNYCVNLEGLVKSMTVGMKKLLDVGRVVGAQSLNSKDKNTIVLKLPLAMPVKPFKSRK